MGDEHDSWLSNLGIDLGKIFGGGPTTETDSSNRQKPAGQGLPISKSVGKGGKNNAEDVKIVQAALNSKIRASLAVDGDCGKKTVTAIKAFQKSMGISNPDGRVDPGKGSAKALASVDSPQPPGDPNVPGKIDLSLRNPKPPVSAKHDPEEDDSGDLLDGILKGVEDFVDDVIKPKETPSSEEELDFDPELVAKVADRIIAKLKAGKLVKVEIQVLEGTSMRGVLEALVKLKKAGKLDALSDQLGPQHPRVGAAVFTIRPQFEGPWRDLVAKLSPKDREAILERTPESVKKANGFREEPAGPEHEEDDENPSEGGITVDQEGITVEASVSFKARKENGRARDIGKTTFGVKLDPSGQAPQAFDVNFKLIGANLDGGWWGPYVSIDASVSLNTSVELSQEQTRTVLEKVRETVKAEIEFRFKRIPVLKRIGLKFFGFGGAEGIGGGGAIGIAF